jgi:hypothetical protein
MGFKNEQKKLIIDADYEGVSIISGTGVAVCTAVVLVLCNSKWKYYHILGVSV